VPAVVPAMPMLTHAQIWAALDRLAARAGLSPSGLAKRAGLDPTTFNKSKRVTADGRARWPSTESVAKSLDAAGASVGEFVALIADNGHAAARAIPLIALARAGNSGYFDDAGFPIGKGWDAVNFLIEDEHAFALQISGDSMQPAYRHGTIIIVSPAAPVRRGDRVVVKTRDSEVMAKELKRKNAKQIELKSLNPDDPDCMLPMADVLWTGRIVWASQ